MACSDLVAALELLLRSSIRITSPKFLGFSKDTCCASSLALKNIERAALSYLAISRIVLGEAKAMLLNFRSEPRIPAIGRSDLVLYG